MQSTWGSKIKYSLFGESHGRGIGITMHGFPSGLCIDMQKINKIMMRRMTGGFINTKRKEPDQIVILSGEMNGYTTGNPLTFYIENKDARSKDYEKVNAIPRPSHADYSQYIKYGEYADLRGGGHLSGRLTAPLTAAGAFILSLDEMQYISIASHINRIGDVLDFEDDNFKTLESISVEKSEEIKYCAIQMFNEKSRKSAEKIILQAIENGDSLGSEIKVSVRGLKAGLGEPFFDSLESSLAHLLFSVPAVKSLEFGFGREFAKSKASIVNDEFSIKDNKVITKTNYSGGINGGISNGMPLNFTLTMRPTPSISREQNTINLKSFENTKLSISGRHDACIGIRALPVIEAVTAMAIYEFI